MRSNLGNHKVPTPLSIRVVALSDASHGFIFRVLLNVTLVVGGLLFAVIFEAFRFSRDKIERLIFFSTCVFLLKFFVAYTLRPDPFT